MRRDDAQRWMWSEAVAMLDRAERLHSQFFQPQAVAHEVVWEPPADVLELEDQVLIFVAVPGVDPDAVKTVIDADGVLHVSGRRVMPAQFRAARIHRLELPQGRFERRLPLPAGRYAAAHRSMMQGCLVIALEKLA